MEQNFVAINRFIKSLKGSQLTAQQKRTLKGQALGVDLQGALKGYQRLQSAKRQNMKGSAV